MNNLAYYFEISVKKKSWKWKLNTIQSKIKQKYLLNFKLSFQNASDGIVECLIFYDTLFFLYNRSSNINCIQPASCGFQDIITQ